MREELPRHIVRRRKSKAPIQACSQDVTHSVLPPVRNTSTRRGYLSKTFTEALPADMMQISGGIDECAPHLGAAVAIGRPVIDLLDKPCSLTQADPIWLAYVLIDAAENAART
jgi:hypothetical protein